MIRYNEYNIGGMVIKIPVYTAHNTMFIMGEFKDIYAVLETFEDKAYEETKKMEEKEIAKHAELRKRAQSLREEITKIDDEDVSQISRKVELQKDLRETESGLFSIRETLQQLGEYFGEQSRHRKSMSHNRPFTKSGTK